jgi:16S rRNA (uracil1498-N3)-methyltransferase
VTLGPAESHHLRAVLRLEEGDAVRLFTGDGQEFAARVMDGDGAGVRLHVVECCAVQEEAGTEVVLAFAPPPGQRGDILVEKAVELGVTVLQPVVCERSQGWERVAVGRRGARWLRKAEEAARQCGRSRLPELAPAAGLAEFVGRSAQGLRLVGEAGAGRGLWSLLAGTSGCPPGVTVLVGPPGGFTRAEAAGCGAAGFVSVRLGPGTLRVETAAVSMLAVVRAWLDDLCGRPAERI